MSGKFLLAILIWCVAFSQGAAQENIAIVNNARSIQIDGFLIEWKTGSADTLHSYPFVWDAVNTPQGIAGYFRYQFQDSCWKMNLQWYPDFNAMHSAIKMTIDTAVEQSMLYAFDKSDLSQTVVVEWLLPWDSVLVDTSGTYRVGLYAATPCGDTIPPVIFHGTTYHKQQKDNSIITPRIKIQFISILVLLALFLWLRKKTKRITKR